MFVQKMFIMCIMIIECGILVLLLFGACLLFSPFIIIFSFNDFEHLDGFQMDALAISYLDLQGVSNLG